MRLSPRDVFPPSIKLTLVSRGEAIDAGTAIYREHAVELREYFGDTRLSDPVRETGMMIPDAREEIFRGRTLEGLYMYGLLSIHMSSQMGG